MYCRKELDSNTVKHKIW